MVDEQHLSSINKCCCLQVSAEANQMVKRKGPNVHRQHLGEEIENPATYGVRVGVLYCSLCDLALQCGTLLAAIRENSPEIQTFCCRRDRGQARGARMRLKKLNTRR